MTIDPALESERRIFDREETCCDESDVFLTITGEFVCRACGTCAGSELVGHERRAYTSEERKDRRRTEPRWRKVGARTIIPKTSLDSNGHSLSAKKRSIFSRLSRIHKSLITSEERNYWDARPKLSRMASRVGVPDHVQQTAWKIYVEAVAQRFTMGRSIEAFVSMSLYAAIRIHNFPRVLDDIFSEIKIPSKGARRALALIVGKVLPVLGFKYKPINPRLFVYRYGNEMGLSISLQRDAANLLSNAVNDGMNVDGKDPKGIVAAVLYFSSLKGKERRTQTVVAGTCRVTEVTLRTRVKQLKEWINRNKK
jgi:transcription initiation factor TFIIB